jgi:CHAT domain-containing protein/Tfp pilus assembly protein PilF
MYRRVVLQFISSGFARQSLCVALASLTAFSCSLITIGYVQADSTASASAPLLAQQTNTTPTAQEATALEPGKPIERALAGGQKHSYQITLDEGQYARVMVEQRGLDLSVGLFGVDGKLIAEIDFESRNHGQEKIEFVAEATGRYRLEVKPTLKSAPANHYEISLHEARPATALDRSLSEASKLFAEATRLYWAQKSDAALPLAERAAQMFEQSSGTEQQDFARALNLVANLYLAKKEYAKAEPLYQRALEIRERVLGAEHPDVAASCYDLARFHSAKRDLAKAESFSQRALAIRERVLDPNHFQLGLTLYNYAGDRANAREYAKSEELFLRAVSVLEKALGDDAPQYSNALHNLGFLYDTTGDFAKARQLYQRELASREKAYGQESGEAAFVLHYIARVHHRLGEYDEAEALYRRALAIAEKLRDEDGVLVALGNLAGIQNNRGDYEGAEALYQQVLERQEQAATPNQTNIASTLLNLGIANNNQGDFASAEQYLKRSLSLIEVMRKGEGLELAHILRHLASSNIGKGDYATAEQLCRRALAIYERINGPNHPFVAETLNKLGRVAYLKEDYPGAEAAYRRALTIYEKSQGMNNPRVVAPLRSLAHIYAEQGNAARAVEFQSRATAIGEYQLALALATGSEQQKLRYLAAARSNIDQNLTFNLRHPTVQAKASELAATTALQLKGRVLDAMTDTLAALRRHANPEDQALLDQLNASTAQLAKRVLDSPATVVSTESQAQIKALEEKREKLEDQISRRSAEFRAQKQAVTLDAIRRTIPERAALLEFVIYRPHRPKAVDDEGAYGEPRYAVCVIRRQGAALWQELGATKEIDQAVAALRQALRDPQRQDVSELARALDEKIMRPVRPLLGDATQLLISPDGALNLIPFEALVDEQNRYLIESFACTYLTSGRDLLRWQAARAHKGRPLLLANPLFGEPEMLALDKSNIPKAPRATSANRRQRLTTRQSVTTGSELSSVYFAPLTGTAQEAQAIKALFAEASLLTGRQATETLLKQVAAPNILHIATHGFFLTDSSAAGSSAQSTRAISANAKIANPLLRSGLALVGANLRQRGADDGILTALEAAGLNLWGTKLVTLSACDTGVGEVKNGEGVYGLRRAFVLAGTETLVMSLWPVSDYVTRELMTSY